jgi:hypothetical protein
MERKEKRIIRYNAVDFMAVVLIAALAVLVLCKLVLGGGDSPAQQEMTQVTYTVKVEGVAAELYENALAHLPSKLMASGELLSGQIESVRKEPYYVLGADGSWVEDPAHVTLLFTATTETPTGDVMTTKVGEQEVRIGKTDYILKSEYIEFSGGTIVDVRWES